MLPTFFDRPARPPKPCAQSPRLRHERPAAPPPRTQTHRTRGRGVHRLSRPRTRRFVYPQPVVHRRPAISRREIPPLRDRHDPGNPGPRAGQRHPRVPPSARPRCPPAMPTKDAPQPGHARRRHIPPPPPIWPRRSARSAPADTKSLVAQAAHRQPPQAPPRPDADQSRARTAAVRRHDEDHQPLRHALGPEQVPRLPLPPP